MSQLSHPAKASGMERFSGNYDEREFAVYKMVSLAPASTEALLKTMLDGGGIPSAARLAPQPDFADQSLQEVIEKHLQVTSQTDIYNPRTFIVVTASNWQEKGVLLVNLNCDGQSSIDTVSVPADQAVTLLMGLEIGNTDWNEVKESVGAKTTVPSVLPQEPQVSRKIAVYTFANANMRILTETLESLAEEIDEQGWAFQVPVWSNFTGSDKPQERILAAHKQLWERYGYDKSVYVVADRQNFAEEGWLLVELANDEILDSERCKGREGMTILRNRVIG